MQMRWGGGEVGSGSSSHGYEDGIGQNRISTYMNFSEPRASRPFLTVSYKVVPGEELIILFFSNYSRLIRDLHMA